MEPLAASVVVWRKHRGVGPSRSEVEISGKQVAGAAATATAVEAEVAEDAKSTGEHVRSRIWQYLYAIYFGLNFEPKKNN